MEDQIVQKIRLERERGITTESQVVYLLVEIRKLLDRKKWEYPVLRLSCNWTVHVELSLKQAATIVRKVDEIYPRLASGQLTGGDKSELRAFFALNQFHDDLNDVLARSDIRPLNAEEWNRFLGCYLRVIEDCPLVCRAEGLQYVDKVELIKEIARGDTPPPTEEPAIWWALYKNDVHIFMIGANYEKSRRTLTELMEAGAIAVPAASEGS